jgi:oligosaccharide repeat unit polymerase
MSHKKRTFFSLANPAIMWSMSWGGALFLMSFQLTLNLQEVSNTFLMLVVFNILTALFIGSIQKFATSKNSKKIYLSSEKNAINRLFRKVFFFWIFGSFIDVIYSGGIPMLWVVIGSTKDYTDFGISSFHGVVNSCYLLSITILSLKIFCLKEIRYKKWLYVMLCWSIVIFARGIFLSALVQALVVYLLFASIDWRKIGRFLLISVVLILCFGIVGNFRSVDNPLSYLIGEGASGAFFNITPSGFLWVYVYITSGLNNISYNIDTLQPTYTFYYSVLNLIPSFIRNDIDGYVANSSLVELVDPMLNTSTFYSGYLSDFGVLGAGLAAIFLQILSSFFYAKAKKGSLFAVLCYAIFFECVFFSVFYDLLLLLPYLIQIIITGGLYFVFNLKKNKGCV